LHQSTPVHDDSAIATKSAGTDFNSVSRYTDAWDMTTLDVGDVETVGPMTDSISGRTGDSVEAIFE